MTKPNMCIECGKEPKYGKNARCRTCHNQRRNAIRDREKTNKRQKEWLAKNYMNRRRYVYKMRYKLTEQEYDDMLKAQDSKCAICLTPQSELSARLSVDHNHACCPGVSSCGECIRGLLCRSCNLSLGGFKDNEMILNTAINYLQFYKKEKTN